MFARKTVLAGRYTKILGYTQRMVDFVILVHQVHLSVFAVKTSLSVLNYPAATAMLRYHKQPMLCGTR